MKNGSDHPLYQWRTINHRPFSLNILGEGYQKELGTLMVPQALNLLFKLRNAMRFNHIHSQTYTKQFSDGTEVRISSIYGQDTIWIKAPVIEEAAVAAAVKGVLGLWQWVDLDDTNTRVFFMEANSAKNRWIDLSPLIPYPEQEMWAATGTHGGLALLEQNADYGVVVYIDSYEYTHLAIVRFHLLREKPNEDPIMGPGDIENPTYREWEVEFSEVDRSFYSDSLQVSEFGAIPVINCVPPDGWPYGDLTDYYPDACDLVLRNVRCWMDGAESLDNLKWEILSEMHVTRGWTWGSPPGLIAVQLQYAIYGRLGDPGWQSPNWHDIWGFDNCTAYFFWDGWELTATVDGADVFCLGFGGSTGAKPNPDYGGWGILNEKFDDCVGHFFIYEDIKDSHILKAWFTGETVRHSLGVPYTGPRGGVNYNLGGGDETKMMGGLIIDSSVDKRVTQKVYLTRKMEAGEYYWELSIDAGEMYCKELTWVTKNFPDSLRLGINSQSVYTGAFLYAFCYYADVTALPDGLEWFNGRKDFGDAYFADYASLPL